MTIAFCFDTLFLIPSRFSKSNLKCWTFLNRTNINFSASFPTLKSKQGWRCRCLPWRDAWKATCKPKLPNPSPWRPYPCRASSKSASLKPMPVCFEYFLITYMLNCVLKFVFISVGGARKPKETTASKHDIYAGSWKVFCLFFLFVLQWAWFYSWLFKSYKNVSVSYWNFKIHFIFLNSK